MQSNFNTLLIVDFKYFISASLGKKVRFWLKAQTTY